MKLTRAAAGLTTPRERMVHLGLGAFFRAHQAWYTNQVDAESKWGYVAFTGRSADAANLLQTQDGLYTLITRSPLGDEFEVINSIARAEDGNDLTALTEAIVSEQTALVTLTVTEAGYSIDAAGLLIDAETQLEQLTSGKPTTVLGRLAWALNQRRLKTQLGLALVPCDNIPANGHLLATAMEQLFEAFGGEALAWLRAEVSFVSTSIDRITPKTTEADVQEVAASTGWQDASPVVTEPFRDWVLQGEFPLGRPAWEEAGARFVAQIEPFENRKLWLLNGAHSLLAYLGQLRGHQTVAQAIDDLECLEQVTQFWDEAQRTLNNSELQVETYRQALLERFRNPRIAHQLSQIAIDGATKVRVRTVPTALAELELGNSAQGAANVMSAWIAFRLKNQNAQDAMQQQIEDALEQAAGDHHAQIASLLALLDSRLANHPQFLERVIAQVNLLTQTDKEPV
ncbi:MAG: mannitol dehydrogenase family protein [Micrococcales bacterium]